MSLKLFNVGAKIKPGFRVGVLILEDLLGDECNEFEVTLTSDGGELVNYNL